MQKQWNMRKLALGSHAAREVDADVVFSTGEECGIGTSPIQESYGALVGCLDVVVVGATPNAPQREEGDTLTITTGTFLDDNCDIIPFDVAVSLASGTQSTTACPYPGLAWVPPPPVLQPASRSSSLSTIAPRHGAHHRWSNTTTPPTFPGVLHGQHQRWYTSSTPVPILAPAARYPILALPSRPAAQYTGYRRWPRRAEIHRCPPIVPQTVCVCVCIGECNRIIIVHLYTYVCLGRRRCNSAVTHG
jgi:hypothetical protein